MNDCLLMVEGDCLVLCFNVVLFDRICRSTEFWREARLSDAGIEFLIQHQQTMTSESEDIRSKPGDDWT